MTKKIMGIALALIFTLPLFAKNIELKEVSNADRLTICQYILEENYQEEAEIAEYMLNYCVERSQLSYQSYPSFKERTINAHIWFSLYYIHRCEIEMSFDQVGIANCQ